MPEPEGLPPHDPAATGPAAGCSLCRDAWRPWILGHYTRLAADFSRHAELCQCPRCGSLYQVFPEDLKAPARLTIDEARPLFPGAL